MNEDAIAYAFSLLDSGDGDDTVTMFNSSELCRAALLEMPLSVSVIVCNAKGKGSMTPINVAAALCADAPERDVYLMEDRPSKSLAGRVRAAGIRGIIDSLQAEHLLGINRGARIQTFDRSSLVEMCPLSRPTNLVEALPLPQPADPVERSPRSPSVALPEESPLPQAAALVEEASLPQSVALAEESPLPQPVARVEKLPSESSPVLLPVHDADASSTPPALESASSRQGRIIGFFSGRGGVGKSTVALMSAFVAQRHGVRVALVDLDLQFGDLGYLAGAEPSSRIQRLSLAQLCAEDDVPTLADDMLALVLAPDEPEQGEQFAFAISSLLGKLAAQRDLVVINTGSFWADAHVQALRCCDHLVFLMDQRATSIEAGKQAVDLCLRMQIPQARFHYLLNGCGRHAPLMPQDVSLALGGVEVDGLADGGTLVDELLALGCPLELLGSGNAFIASLEKFLDNLMGSQLANGQAVSLHDGKEGRAPKRRARIFDLSILKGFFEGAGRVAT
jgi:pilus assembly protein CpaE